MYGKKKTFSHFNIIQIYEQKSQMHHLHILITQGKTTDEYCKTSTPTKAKTDVETWWL